MSISTSMRSKSPGGKVVPNADRFTYTRCGTPLLDAVMLCSARNWLEMLVEFVNFANREVFGLGCAVGRHEGDADRSSSTQIDLYCIAWCRSCNFPLL